MKTAVGSIVRHSLEALGPVSISDGQHRWVFANRAMMAVRHFGTEVIGTSVWADATPETRKVAEPHWMSDPTDEVLYLPDGLNVNRDGTQARTASVGMWIPYNDGINVGRLRVSAALPVSERPSERSLRNALGIAVQAVQLGQLRNVYEETAKVARGARQVLDDIRLRLAHALRGLDGDPDEELYELRQLVSDLSVILEHPVAPSPQLSGPLDG